MASEQWQRQGVGEKEDREGRSRLAEQMFFCPCSFYDGAIKIDPRVLRWLS